MTSHPNPAAQVFREGGDLLDMLKASRELTHACAIRGAWITAAECHAIILAVSDLTTCRSCQHGQCLAKDCPGVVRVALPSVSPLPDLGAVTAAPEPIPAARLCGETQPVAAPASGPGPITADSSTAGGPGATGAPEAEKCPRIRSDRLGLARVSPRVRKCGQGASPLETEASAPRNQRPKTDPAELRRRKRERNRRARADAALRRREERERAKAERLEEERRQAKLKAAAKARREREAQEREQGRRIRLLRDTLGYLIPRHGGRGTLGLQFTRLIFADRTGVDLTMPEFRDLCEAAGLTITGRSSAAQNIQLDDLALSFAGPAKEAA